ncbi:MAG: ATP-binding protein [Lentisphaeria bacterium]
MFWNKLAALFDTVRAKMCGINVALILVAFLLSFIGIYFFQRNYLLGAMEEKITIFSNEFEYEYLTGDEEAPGTVVIQTQAVAIPDFAAVAISRHRQGMVYIFACESLNATGDRAITVIAEDDGQLFEFMITPNRLQEREITASLQERIASMREEFTEESYGEGDQQVFFLLLSPNGQILAHSRQNPEELRFLADPIDSRAGKTWLSRRRHGDHSVMALYKRLYDGNLLVIAGNLAASERNLAYLASILGVVTVFMLLVGLTGSWLLAGMFLKGINRVKKTAARIAGGDFAHRVEMGREGREINDLAVVFNDMVDKTEKLLRELKTVSDDIAHDLRTPLTVLRGRAELALTSGDCKNLPIQVLEGSDHLLSIINTMLSISQIEAGLAAANREELDLTDVVQQTVDVFLPAAEAQGITLKFTSIQKENRLQANLTAMQKVLGNLVDNAIKFTPPGGLIEIRITEQAGRLSLTVSDTGSGILPEDMENIFKRFYRSDGSRSKPGNGLGLSLVKAIVTAYGGTIAVDSTPEVGTTFRLCFPIVPVTKSLLLEDGSQTKP